MEQFWIWLRMIWASGTAQIMIGLTAIGTAIVWALGGWDEPLTTLMILIFVDYVMGIVCAYTRKELNSTAGWKGIAKKGAYLIVVLVAHFVDQLVMGQTPLARTVVILLLSANEALSVLEHAGKLGVPLPQQLLDRITKLRDDLGGFAKTTTEDKPGDGAKPAV